MTTDLMDLLDDHADRIGEELEHGMAIDVGGAWWTLSYADVAPAPDAAPPPPRPRRPTHVIEFDEKAIHLALTPPKPREAPARRAAPLPRPTRRMSISADEVERAEQAARASAAAEKARAIPRKSLLEVIGLADGNARLDLVARWFAVEPEALRPVIEELVAEGVLRSDAPDTYGLAG